MYSGYFDNNLEFNGCTGLWCKKAEAVNKLFFKKVYRVTVNGFLSYRSSQHISLG
jgi:hypothetical protein